MIKESRKGITTGVRTVSASCSQISTQTSGCMDDGSSVRTGHWHQESRIGFKNFNCKERHFNDVKITEITKSAKMAFCHCYQARAIRVS